MINNKTTIFIVGPTCSGKSDIAFELAVKYNSKIVSADSRQIYKELNIGTAKPPDNYLQRIQHFFINHISINDEYNVAKYVSEANPVIDKILDEKKLPIICGGTGLYINSLLFGIFEGPGKNNEIRNQLEFELKENGIEYLYQKLLSLDPIAANNIDRFNSRRIIRALEVFLVTGKSIKLFQQEQKKEKRNDAIIFGINWDRTELYNRINQRVDDMIRSGLIDEAFDLYQNYKDKNLVAFQTVGYQELFEFFDGYISKEEAIEKIKMNTRRFAKRQLTWFRANKDIIWIEIDRSLNLKFIIEKIRENIERISDV